LRWWGRGLGRTFLPSSPPIYRAQPPLPPRAPQPLGENELIGLERNVHCTPQNTSTLCMVR
jgi:hypothetical protein